MNTKDKKQKNISRAITSMIIFCGCVILITIILVNVYSQKKVVHYQDEELNMGISLSPFTKKLRMRRYMRLRKSRHNRSLQKFKVDTKKMLTEARRFLAAKKNALAEDKLRTLLVFEPDNAPALSLLGGILFYSGRYAEAEAVFRNLIKYHPKQTSAYNNLATAMAKQKKIEEAIKIVSGILKKHPDRSYIYINLASMYATIGKEKKAVENFRKAYELIGDRILPISYDSVFDKIRNNPEFQRIISECQSKIKPAANEYERNMTPVPTIKKDTPNGTY